MEDCVERKLIRCFVAASLFAFLGLVMPAVVSAQQPDFPYQALVVTDGAKVYSGPGEMHYATEELSVGAVVEVYRHDPGGWCAIRPTSESFSLLPQAAVVIADRHVGEVIEDGVQAWVGTALGPVENPLWQIKLKSGERVELLGEISWPEPSGESTAWYQVAPPNGEFRWVHLDDIKLPIKTVPSEFENEDTIAQTMVGGQSPAARQQPAPNAGWRPAKQQRKPAVEPEIQLTGGMEDLGTQLESGGSSNRSLSSAGSSPSPSSSNAFNAFEQRMNENGFVSPARAPQQLTNRQPDRYDNGSGTQRPDRFASADSAFGRIGVGQAEALREIQPMNAAKMSPRLRELDMRLSAEVVKRDYSRWQLQDIGLDVQQIANSPADITEQVAAERLLDKVQNFRKIQASAQSVGTGNFNAGSGTSGRGSAGVGVSDGSDRTASIYDAEGWLNELVRSRGNLNSTYVLQDEAGKITHHVQPAPGLNLNRYLRSKVGIMGPRGFNQQLNLNHVTAERIIVLEKPRR